MCCNRSIDFDFDSIVCKKTVSFVAVSFRYRHFFVAQILIRTPLVNFLGTQPWYINFATNYFILFALLIPGCSTGLLEESAKLVSGKILKRRITLKDAISFG